MVAEDASDAVLDLRCRVRGLDGLSAVEASVFPVVPRVVGHMTIVMIAERRRLAGRKISPIQEQWRGHLS
jgi:choline dehydrogenase-like flavoprotein